MSGAVPAGERAHTSRKLLDSMPSVSIRRVDVQVHLARRDGLSRRVEPNEPEIEQVNG